ncbi:MAG TPA: sensor histidine kinase, partial [Rikenellaceae bacterium]|nr:sensor histidine kinase [Rikenellaceae bacterium]
EYVKLMSARLTSRVKLEVSLPETSSDRQIAPLLFIPLIENAFKHGISDSAESFIRIRLSEDDEYVCCLVENSCHPKDDTDRSGSGIGITNLKRRLDLLYPGAYSFEYGRVQSVYRSLLRIKAGI